MLGLDWAASACGLLGCVLVGSGYKYGWLLYAVASGINGYIGFHSGYMGMAVGALIYCLLELRGYWRAHRS